MKPGIVGGAGNSGRGSDGGANPIGGIGDIPGSEPRAEGLGIAGGDGTDADGSDGDGKAIGGGEGTPGSDPLRNEGTGGVGTVGSAGAGNAGGTANPNSSTGNAHLLAIAATLQSLQHGGLSCRHCC